MADEDEYVTTNELATLDKRITEFVDKMNKVNEKGRSYVDDSDEKQTSRLKDMEKRLTDLIETKVKNYDKLVRRKVVEEFAKIGK
jgi:hypothetical protein